MSFLDQITIQYAAGGATAVQAQWSVTGVGRVAYSGSIPDTTSSAGQLVNATFLHAEVLSCFLLSTQDMTINVDSDGSPTQAITLTANQPILANPFTVNVATGLYLRNHSVSTAATVTLIILLSSSSS